MRDYKGISIGGIEDKRVRDALNRVDTFLRDAGAAMGSLSKGTAPTTSKNYIGGTGGGGVSAHSMLSGLSADDHTQYLLLAGRGATQTISATASAIVPLNVRAFDASSQVVSLGYGTTEYTKMNGLGQWEFTSGINARTIYINTTGPGLQIGDGSTRKALDFVPTSTDFRIRATPGATVYLMASNATGTVLWDFTYAGSGVGNIKASNVTASTLSLDAGIDLSTLSSDYIKIDSGGAPYTYTKDLQFVSYDTGHRLMEGHLYNETMTNDSTHFYLDDDWNLFCENSISTSGSISCDTLTVSSTANIPGTLSIGSVSASDTVNGFIGWGHYISGIEEQNIPRPTAYTPIFPRSASFETITGDWAINGNWQFNCTATASGNPGTFTIEGQYGPVLWYTALDGTTIHVDDLLPNSLSLASDAGRIQLSTDGNNFSGETTSYVLRSDGNNIHYPVLEGLIQTLGSKTLDRTCKAYLNTTGQGFSFHQYNATTKGFRPIVASATGMSILDFRSSARTFTFPDKTGTLPVPSDTPGAYEVLKYASGATQEDWGAIDNNYIANRTRYIDLPAHAFGDAGLGSPDAVHGTYPNNTIGHDFPGTGSEAGSVALFFMPADAVAGNITWSLFFQNETGASANSVYIKIYEHILATGANPETAPAASATAASAFSLTGTPDQYMFSFDLTPALSVSAGNMVRLSVGRDPAQDTPTGSVLFLGARGSYTADM